ncbi:RDD family protein [Psychroserpens burtonensis]|uniref:RDD family protein n=1 Tax=Psychroserpens burtonensis TaxID=49278 RepID=A0A5C7B8M6_9FLAO|nr:RDD family protein [Psychroserpens burtonensis]TXE16287.1 RDD family protein [Psychroserpens burtonensis]
MNPIKYTVTTDILATKGMRFANFIIDYIVQIILGVAIGMVIGVVSELTGSYGLYDLVVETEGRLSDYIFGAVILIVYYLIIETLTARSLGKYITNTKVVLYDGSKPTFNEILVRTLCRIIPFEQFSFLGDVGKGWHDSISKTYVVDNAKFESQKATFEGLDEIGRIGE